MSPFALSYSELQIALLIFFRVAGIIFMVPVLNSRNIPIFVKIFFSIICTGIFFPLKVVHQTIDITSVFQLTIAIITEITIGLIIGYVAQLFFASIMVGGQLLGIQTGFSIASILDPTDNAHNSVFAGFLNILATLIFLSINGHHWFFEALGLSFKIIPLGKIHLSPKLLLMIINSFNEIFVCGIKIAAPIMGTVLILDAVLGILSRIVPQIEVFMLSFPLKIAGGFIVLALSLNFIVILLQRMFSTLPGKIAQVINLLAG